MRMSKALRAELERVMSYMEIDTPYNSSDAFGVLRKILGYAVDGQGNKVELTDEKGQK